MEQRVKIEIEGESFELKFKMEALCSLENHYGKPVSKLHGMLVGEVKLNDIIEFLRSALVHKKEFSKQELIKMLDESDHTMKDVIIAVKTAYGIWLSECIKDGKDTLTDDEKKNTKAGT